MLYLNVPYIEKDEAKNLGARWDPQRKKWYAPDYHKYGIEKYYFSHKHCLVIIFYPAYKSCKSAH